MCGRTRRVLVVEDIVGSLPLMITRHLGAKLKDDSLRLLARDL
jgi:hypothetical protein